MHKNIVYKTPGGKYFVSIRKCNRTIFGGTFKHRKEAEKKAQLLVKQTNPKKIVCMY